MAVVGSRSEAASQRLYQQALELMPGGVSSPVRAMRSVGRDHPLFAVRGEGGWLIDVDGNRYVDWVQSWGPLIAGHAHPRIVQAVTAAAARGTTFGAPTELEIELARSVKDAVPSIELVRFVSSGTEATMSAVRLARACTGRNKILKFTGGYHGHVDALLAQGGSGLATLAIPSTPGVPEAVTADTLLCEYNDLDAARALAERHGDELACVIVEPVAGNMGVIAARPGFLEGLRAICNGAGALLILDEVITGFRVAYGGAQERLAVRADLTCLGKIVGGGLPAAAFGGRGDLMERLAPLGDVYQAGTLAGNPLAMAAGSATLELLREEGAYDRLEHVSATLGDGLASTGVTVNRVGAMLTGFFHPGPVECFADAARSDTGRYAAFHAHMLDRGVYLAPSQFEAMMPSLAHTAEQIEQTVAAAREFAGVSVLAEVAVRAGDASPLWQEALLDAPAPESEFAGRCPDDYLLGVEMIREGYLLHRGRSRLFRQDDAELALLTGDHLYAAGLVEICRTRDLEAVASLAELIAACAGAQAEPGTDDEQRWAETVASLGRTA